MLSQIFRLIVLQVFLFANACAENQNIGRPLADTLCLGVKFSQGQSQSDLPMLTDLGVKWVRDGISWGLVEPKAGVYVPFPSEFLERLNFYKSNDIGVVVLLAYGNKVAYPDSYLSPHSSLDPEAYGKYAEVMARRLKAMGINFVLELWNEPHNNIQAALGGHWAGAPPSPWVDHYLKMVAEAVKRVKAFDANIKLLTNDDMWIIHYHFLERGLPKQLDGFAIHPYTGGGPPEVTAVGQDAGWTLPYTVVDKDRSFESAMRRLREAGMKKLGKPPELWITEWGWQVGEKGATGPVTEELVATYLPRAFILAAAAGAQATCWFSAQDSVDGPMGLKDNRGRFRPAYQAFKNLSAQLGKAGYLCEIPLEASLAQIKRAFLFKDGKSWLIASWATDTNAPLELQSIHINRLDVQPTCKTFVTKEGYR